MPRIVESFLTFSQFFKKYFKLPAREKVILQMDELFGNSLNLKGLVILVSDLCWMEVSHGGVDFNLLLPALE